VLRLTVVTGIPGSGAEVFFALPPGVTPVYASATGGRVTLAAQLEPNVPATFDLEVRLDEAGEQVILAGATLYVPAGSTGDQSRLVLDVSATGSQIKS
jgi:hypothetical protein